MNTENIISANISDLIINSSVWFVVTNKCNLKCKYCFNYLSGKCEFMSPKLAKAIIAHYVESQNNLHIHHPYVRIIFFGGEPSLNIEAILAVVNYLDDNKIPCFPKIITNGIIADSVLEQLIAKKIAFQISFDGEQNNLRGSCANKELNKQIIKTIETVVANELPLSIRCTVHAGNVNAMSKYIKFAAAHKVKTASFCPVCLEGNAAENGVQRASISDYMANFVLAKEVANKLNVELYAPEMALCGNKVSFPLVWLPDGKLMLVNKYSSSTQKGAENAIIGSFCQESNDIKIDTNQIAIMNKKFHYNCGKYCKDCKIYESCQGMSSFVNYSLFSDLHDKYMCEIANEMNQLCYTIG